MCRGRAGRSVLIHGLCVCVLVFMQSVFVRYIYSTLFCFVQFFSVLCLCLWLLQFAWGFVGQRLIANVLIAASAARDILAKVVVSLRDRYIDFHMYLNTR